MVRFSYEGEGVILPDRPLVLVHRDWSRPFKSTNVLHQASKKGGDEKIKARQKSLKNRARQNQRALGEAVVGSVDVEASPYKGRQPSALQVEQTFRDAHAFRATSSMRTDQYVSHYLYAIADTQYPFSERLKFNPIRDRCFQIAAMNETWFLTIIYCSARHLATTNSSNPQYSRDATQLMEMVLERLRRSVEMTSKGELPSDETICAIACLTTLESGLANAVLSKAHARGLAELVRARGGVDQINEDLRAKVCRADMESALDSDTLPLLPFTKQIQPCMGSVAARGSSFFGHPLFAHVLSYLDPSLAQITIDLSELSDKVAHAYARQYTLDPNGVDETAVHILHSLLVYEPVAPNSLESAFRVAAMIFMKTLMRKFSALPETSKVLSKRLHEQLEEIWDIPMLLSRWMNFMGLLSASTGSDDRAYFASRIPQCTWSEMKEDLSKVLWVDALHDTVGERVWIERQVP